MLWFPPAALSVYLLVTLLLRTKTSMFPWPSGLRYFWLDDDMMISMRYAQNLARGDGFVWNAGGERVEGYTNPLWVLVMTIPHLLGFPSRLAAAFIIGLNVVLFPILIGAFLWLGRKLRLSTMGLWIGAWVLATNQWLLYWAVGGSSEIAMALLILLASGLVLCARQHRPVGIALGLVLSGITFLRSDGLVIYFAFLPILFLLKRSGRLLWSTAVIPSFVLISHFLFRKLYYGEWLPNTYYLKVVDFPMKSPHGFEYISEFIGLTSGILLVQLLSVFILKSPFARILGLLPWVVIAYVFHVGGDELEGFRFLIPVIPMLLLWCVATFERAVPRLSGHSYRYWPGRHFWLALLFIIGAHSTLCLPHGFSQLGARRSRLEWNNMRLALLIKRNTDPDALIAHYMAGAVPYFSERPAHDMLGKNDPKIAHGPGRRGFWHPGHAKYDAAYTLSLKPDVIVTAMPANRLDAEIRANDFALWNTFVPIPALYGLYDEPEFLKDYAPYLVEHELSEGFHAVFIRKGSQRAEAPQLWTFAE